MKKLDWYILRKYLSTFVFIIGLLCVISVMIDYSEKASRYFEKGITFAYAFKTYYLYFVQFIISLIAPLFVFLGVIFFTSQLAARSEIVAMLASGISLRRITRPYIMGAAIVATGLFIFNHFSVPSANKHRVKFERHIYNRKVPKIHRNINRQIEPGRYIFIRQYNARDTSLLSFALEQFDENERLVHKVNARRANWIDSTKQWRIYNYTIRRFNQDSIGETIETGTIADSTFNFRPEQFSRTISDKDELNSFALRDLIEERKATGVGNTEPFEVELYRRSASAVSVFILTFIGFFIAGRKTRGGMGLHLVTGIGLSALYEIFTRFAMAFSTAAGLSTMIGAWFPNIIFSFVAIYLYLKAQK